MRTLWLMYKTEAKLSVREFSSVLFGVLVPIGLMILLGVLYGDSTLVNDSRARQVDVSFSAVATLGICSAGLMGVPLALSDYRWRKILKRYKVTPISPIILLLAHVFFCFSLSIISTLLVYIVAAAMFGFSLKCSALTFILAYLLVMVSMHAIGLIIASLAPNSKTAGVICSLIYFTMIFISGATIPYEIMPKAMQTVSDFMPLTQGIKLLKTVSMGEPLANSLLSLTVLIVFAIAGTCIAVKFFKWE